MFRVSYFQALVSRLLPLLIVGACNLWLVSELSAQVVQLPAYRQTGFSGTVSVPDGGTALLGGVGYSASGSTSRGWGPFASRAIGGQAGGSSLALSAEIIDLQAMDEAILGSSTSHRPSSMGPAGSPVNQADRSYLGGYWTGPTTSEQVKTTNPNQWQLALAGGVPSETSRGNESQVEADIRYFLAQGKEAEQKNRILAARVYYRMAVERMTPEMVQRYKQLLADRAAAEQAERERLSPDRIKF